MPDSAFCRRASESPELWRAVRRGGAGLALWLVFGSTSASAQLAAPFSSTLTVDTDYVTGVTAATDIAFSADGRAVVTAKSGLIAIRQPNGTKVNVNGTFSGVNDGFEQGLLGVVADPNVATNNAFYFYVSNGPTDDRHRVYRAVLGQNNSFTVDSTPVIAASRNNGPGLEGPLNHNGGGMFIHDGMLYVGVGDSGANATPPTNKYGSCLNRPNGKILRVALNGDIPASNPLANVAQVTACDASGRTGGAWTTAAPDRRIFAWGFRNPWRLWVDPMTGRLWVGDVGETTREEISTGTGDAHYGWPFREGTTTYSPIAGKDCMTDFQPPRPCTAPVHDYARASGATVVGGLIPSGCGWQTALGNRTLYFFADYLQNFLRALEVNSARTGVVSSTPINVGTFSGGMVSLRMGPDESFYIVLHGANAVYRVTPTDRTGCGMGGMGGMGGMAGAGGMAGGMGGMAGGMGGLGGAGAGGAGPVAGAGMGGDSTAGMGGTPGAGMGGDGAAGASGNGTGGAGGDGVAGGQGTAGSGASAGSPSGGAPSGGAPTGGAPTGGVPSAGMGAVTDPGAGSALDEEGGCSCRIGARPSPFWAVLGAASLLSLALRRKKRQGRCP